MGATRRGLSLWPGGRAVMMLPGQLEMTFWAMPVSGQVKGRLDEAW